jgi:large subunit ribosomal protein L30
MFAVIRIRGTVNRFVEIEDTMNMLRLSKVNNCVLVPEKKEYLGMVKKAKDFITWGTIDKTTLSKLLEKRCKILGDKNLNLEELKEITDFDDFDSFADALINGKANLKDYKRIKPVFRLSPPKKGFRSTRMPFPKGDLGNRNEKINELVERMM